MPIYEYECKIHGRFERVRPVYKYNETALCFNEDCVLDCEKVWSQPANIQVGKPTIVFINPQTGLSQVATSQYDSPPPGYIVQELKGPIERSKFEQIQNAIHAQEDAIYNENLRQNREAARDDILKDIDKNLREDAQASDNPELTAKLMKAAKEHIKKKPSLKRKRQSEFRFDVNHLDKSNLK